MSVLTVAEESRRVAKLIIWIYHHPKISMLTPTEVDDIAENKCGSPDALARMTATLCSAVHWVGEADIYDIHSEEAKDLRAWWADHNLRDENKLKNANRINELRISASAKLSPDERDAVWPDGNGPPMHCNTC